MYASVCEMEIEIDLMGYLDGICEARVGRNSLASRRVRCEIQTMD